MWQQLPLVIITIAFDCRDHSVSSEPTPNHESRSRVLKRRQILIASGGLLAAGLPFRAQSTPCPPPTTSLDGGVGVPTACSSNGLSDWNSRTSAAGVIWAQRFTSQSDVNRGVSGGGHSSQQFVANDGIIGDGCLSQVVPANQGIGGRWHRPMGPLPGDINEPGFAVGPSVSNYPDGCGGLQNPYIGNRAYWNTPHGNPLRTGTFFNDEFYFQYRLKFSPGRLGSNQPGGKLVMFETNWTNPTQELVMTAKKNATPTSAVSCYTHQGGFGANLGNPQGSGGFGSNDQQQPTGFPSCTFNNPGSCFNYVENQWMTFLVRWKAGLNAVSTSVPPTDPINNPARNSQVTIWGALAGQRNYTLIHDKSDYVFHYQNDAMYNTSGLHAYGLNWVGLDFYTGGNSFIPSPTGFYHRFDQLIFSTQPIACPQV